MINFLILNTYSPDLYRFLRHVLMREWRTVRERWYRYTLNKPDDPPKRNW
jgi:hypothetical protein